LIELNILLRFQHSQQRRFSAASQAKNKPSMHARVHTLLEHINEYATYTGRGWSFDFAASLVSFHAALVLTSAVAFVPQIPIASFVYWSSFCANFRKNEPLIAALQ
jgi:hypothetical protein